MNFPTLEKTNNWNLSSYAIVFYVIMICLILNLNLCLRFEVEAACFPSMQL